MSKEDELKRKVWREVQRERREKIAKAKAGRKVKGVEIVNGFNPDKTIQPSRGDLRAAGIDVNVDEDAQSAYQMLQFLRYAFRNSKGSDGKKGKERLVKLMESDSEFKFFVRELAKIETSLLAATIRKTGDESGGGGVNNNFFVVLKGLEEDKKILEMADKDVDIKQIARAMNPDGTEME